MNPMRAVEGGAVALAKRAVALTEFILSNRGRAFEGWEPMLIFHYVAWHLGDGTAFVTSKGTQAVAFAWGMPEAEIRKLAAAGEPTFDWKRSRDWADAIFIAEVVADKSAGDAKPALQDLRRQMLERWPEFERRKIFTYRAGRLVELAHPVIQKLLTYGR